MKTKHFVGALVVVGILLGGASSPFAQEEALSAEGAELHTIDQFLGPSRDAVDVYKLTCLEAHPLQVARAQVLDTGGVDGIKFYVHFTFLKTGAPKNGYTDKRTAPDGGASLSVTQGGFTHFVVVGKD